MASPLIYANNVASLLAANIGPSDTALLVTPGQGVRFPALGVGQYFYLTLIHVATGVVEVVRCTARSTDTLTIVRGQDGTTATSFASGSAIEMRGNAQLFREIDWRTTNNVANSPVVLDGAGLISDTLIPAGITRDAELTAGLATKQNSLGYTPVREGGGVGQLANQINIGWLPSVKLGLTVDGATDRGVFAMEGWVDGAWLTSVRGVASKLASLDAGGLVPVGQIPALGYLPLAGGALTGVVTSSSNISTSGNLSGSTVTATGSSFASPTTQVVLSAASGYVYLRPNGPGSAVGQLYLTTGGVAVATDFIATSDYTMKKDIHAVPPRAHLADLMEWKAYRWKADNRAAVGLIAQHVREHAPEHVYVGVDGKLGVDKASLALEMVIGLSSRIRHLEAITNA